MNLNWEFIIINSLRIGTGCSFGACLFWVWLTAIDSAHHDIVISQPHWLVYLSLAFFLFLGAVLGFEILKDIENRLFPPPETNALELLKSWGAFHPEELAELKAEVQSGKSFILSESVREWLLKQPDDN
jgi:hypothetical protein